VRTHHKKEIYVRRISVRLAGLRGDEGMSTAEYAVGCLAAVAFAGVLFKVLNSPSILTALTGVINEALK
jgi:hypothetical protein